MGDSRVGHHGGREYTVSVAFAQGHDAVGGEQHRCRDIVEFRLLILPAGAEVTLQLGVLFQFRVAVRREHFAVGVDVDPLAVGLFQQQFHIVEVMTADHDEGSLLDRERNLRGDRVAVGLGVGVVKEFQALEVDVAGFQHQGKEGFLGAVLADLEQRLVEELVHLPACVPEHTGVVGVRRHSL